MAAQSTICLIFCIFAIFYYVESKSPKSRQRQNDSNNCKNVEWGPCQNLTKQNGVCGHGIKKGKGAGVGCENIERQCKVACPGKCKSWRCRAKEPAAAETMDDSTVPTNPSSSRRQKNNVKTAAADAKCQKSQNVVNGTEICGGRRGRKRGTGGASMRKL